jgi:hypothetical protein
MKIARVLVTLATAAAAVVALGVALPAGASTGTEHFTILSNDPAEDATAIVIANGPVHARGTDITVSNTNDRFVFPDGNLKLHHSTTAGTSKDTFDPTTCYSTHTERGTFVITRGTGAYKGATGSGTYRLKVAVVGCDENSPPEYFSLVVHAVGDLTI